MPDLPKQQLGHYRLVHLIGHGGFADVYLGEHIYLGTQAAIKTIATRFSSEEIDLFQTEARTIARLEHPHIVRVLDFGVEEKRPFLVMSYAPGGTLRKQYPQGTQLPLDKIVSNVKQIASALQYAHSEQLVHRDIKPENMLLDRHGNIMLSDFGLAVVAQSSSRMPQRDISGTIVYMAPEQARGKPRPASDQYALAVVVYEWLCGQRPFQGTYEEVVIQHALSQPPSIQEKRPDIAPAVAAVVQKALAKDPHQRFTSVQDFAKALELAYQVIPTALTSVTLERPVTTAPLTPLIPTTQQEPHVPPPPQPDTACPSETGSTDTIYTLAWSPDKRRIAYGGRERSIEVRGTTTGSSMAIYHGHSSSVTSIAWSPDGHSIASASLDRTIQVWDATSGNQKARYDAHSGMVYALTWSPNNQYIASTSSGKDKTVHVWQAQTGQEHLIYREHSYWIRALSWSPDNAYLASGSWHEVHVWESQSGRKLFSYRGHTSWVRIVSWSPDGTKIASAGEDKTVQIWEPPARSGKVGKNKGHTLVTYRGHNDWITDLVWSPDGNWIASADKDRHLHIWDVASATIVQTHHIRTHSTYALTWLADSKHVVLASGNGSVQVFRSPE